MDTHPLDGLFQRLRGVAHRDPEQKIFGASMHQWQVFSLSAAECAEVETRHALTLPEAYRWWVERGPGAGAGPFYGIQHPLDTERCVDELAGALPLSDHGCGYADYLFTRGEHAGQVWVDFRDSDGPLCAWYPSFAAWLDAWLLRTYAEWGVEYVTMTPPKPEDAEFLRAVEQAMERVDADRDDPICAQYPVPQDKLRVARGRLLLLAGRLDEARAMFAAATSVSREPQAMQALAECDIALANNDFGALLAAADAGLASTPLWFISESQLRAHRATALAGMGERVDT